MTTAKTKTASTKAIVNRLPDADASPPRGYFSGHNTVSDWEPRADEWTDPAQAPFTAPYGKPLGHLAAAAEALRHFELVPEEEYGFDLPEDHFDEVVTGGGPMTLDIVRPIAGKLLDVLDEMKRFRYELAGHSPTLAQRLLDICDHFEAALR